jgi:hypothetical protein
MSSRNRSRTFAAETSAVARNRPPTRRRWGITAPARAARIYTWGGSDVAPHAHNSDH